MTRTPYILKEEEIDVLVAGMIDHGEEEAYSRMRKKTMSSIKEKADLDEMLLDMHETLIIRAREMTVDKDIQKILYQLASMLRILAHELYREYIKTGSPRDNERFIRLVSLNKNIPSAS